MIDLVKHIIAILLLFQLKHLIIDFFWQPEYEWRNKGTFLHWGGIRHALKHGIASYIFLVLFISAPAALLFCLIESIVHYTIDYCKINLNKAQNWKPERDPGFWYLLGIDQFLHQITYILIVEWIVYLNFM